MNFRYERIADHFEKWYVEGLPYPCAFHHFTGPDHGDPHDHPFGLTSHVLSGGYVEEVFYPNGAPGMRGRSELVTRAPGTVHTVAATHIHRIVSLPAGECWTFVIPGPLERETRFWRFDETGAMSRPWHHAEYEPAVARGTILLGREHEIRRAA